MNIRTQDIVASHDRTTIWRSAKPERQPGGAGWGPSVWWRACERLFVALLHRRAVVKRTRYLGSRQRLPTVLGDSGARDLGQRRCHRCSSVLIESGRGGGGTPSVRRSLARGKDTELPVPPLPGPGRMTPARRPYRYRSCRRRRNGAAHRQAPAPRAPRRHQRPRCLHAHLGDPGLGAGAARESSGDLSDPWTENPLLDSFPKCRQAPPRNNHLQ